MTDKKERRKFDKALLDECIKRDGATLVGEYKKITVDLNVKYICVCGKEYEKNMRQLSVVSGAFCKICTFTNRRVKTKKTNLEKYGVESPLQNKDIMTKVKETHLQKYGGHPTKLKETQEKKKKTVEEKYGVDNISKVDEIKQKKELRALEKYDVKNISQAKEVQDKKINSCRENFGVDFPLQSTLVQQKCVEASLQKYGVENVAQAQEVQERIQRNAKKYKEYKMPSGTIRKVQGYEPFALDTLIKTYTEDQIKTDRKDVPRIEYEVDGKKKYYFPDIFLPHENKLIEVKSTWTYKCKTDNIQLKAEACKKQGYNYEIWCYDGKGNRINV